MQYLRGEDINIGVGMEDPVSRGSLVAPQVWIPGKTPTGIAPILEKILRKETKATGIDSQASDIVQKRAEGDLEFNLRNESIGWLLKSLIGEVDSNLNTDGGETGTVYKHVFTVLAQNPEFPSLSLGLSQPNIQDYQYALTLVKTLEIRTPVEDLVNATVGFLSKGESAKGGSAFSPSFESTDYLFRHQDVTIKIADVVGDLDSAAALSLKEFAVMFDNNARVDQNIGELNPGNVLANLLKMSITLRADRLEILDQKIGGITNTYDVPVAVSEAATDKQTFTPTKKHQTKVVFKVDTVGTGIWTIVVHDSSHVLIASWSIFNDEVKVGYNTAILPWTWTSGDYHIHIISTVADGKVKSTTLNDLEDAEMSFFAAAYHDLFTGGSYKALRVEMERDDITIGDLSHPKLTIDFPKVSIEEYTPDRPLEDIATVGMTLAVHYDDTAGVAKAVELTLINEEPNYNKA